MNLCNYIDARMGSRPKDNVVGVESDWLDIGEIDLQSGELWVGDPMVAGNAGGQMLRVTAGHYRVEGMGIDYEGHRLIARCRIVLDETTTFRRGKELESTGTDCARIALADATDVRGIGNDLDEGELQSKILEVVEETCGVATLYLPSLTMQFAYTETGFGDGTFSTFALVSAGKSIGMEVEFIPREVED